MTFAAKGAARVDGQPRLHSRARMWAGIPATPVTGLRPPALPQPRFGALPHLPLPEPSVGPSAGDQPEGR